jgi:hypothetical protein
MHEQLQSRRKLMTLWQKALREYCIWRQNPTDRIRWLFTARNGVLAQQSFAIGTSNYPYFIHAYNHTWLNERAVEVPYILDLLRSAPTDSTLEIGNVLSHYFEFDHAVVDKWEKCYYRPIINSDLNEFIPEKPFDLIISISTIEHVGWDERPRKPEQVLKALDKIQSLLSPKGKAVLTIPVGYNQYLDTHVEEWLSDTIKADCLKRLSRENQWAEVELGEALACQYGSPYQGANAVIFLTITPKNGQPG